MVRGGLALLALAILVVAFLVGFFLERRFQPTPEGRLTILVGTIAPPARGSEELGAFLREELERAGLADRVEVRIEHRAPADEAAALALLRRNHAQMLLWGEGQGSPPRYFLFLAIYPRPDAAVPEFAEYLRTIVTPPVFSLGEPEKGSGLSQEEIASLLTWLAHLYLGEFDRAEGTTPQLPPEAASVVRFHQGALAWLRGDYAGARSAFEGLVSHTFVTTLGGATADSYGCPASATPAFCAALLNDLGVTILTREQLGELPPGSLDDAIHALEVAVQTEDRPLYRYNLGRAYVVRGKPDQAIPHLDRAVEQGDGDAEAMAWLSIACTAVEEAGRARTMADRAIKADRSLAAGELALGLHLLAAGDLKGSERVLAQARRLAEAETSRRRSWEGALREGQRANPQRAEYAAAWARRNNPVLAQVHLAQAQLDLKRGEQEGRTPFWVWLWRVVSKERAPFDAAQVEIEAALALHPNWNAARRLQAELLSVRGKVEQAIETLRALQQEDPADIATYQALAQQLEKRWKELRSRPGEEEQAGEVLGQIREQYQLLVDRRLSPAQGYLGLGRIAQEAGEAQEARQAYLQAIASDPQFAEAYLRLGWLEKELGEEEGALKHLKQAAEYAGGKDWIRVLAYCSRGEILLEQSLRSEGERERSERRGMAREAFEAARRVWPGFASALNGLGRIAYEEGDLKGAERYFLQALDEDRDNFGALYGLGRVYEARQQSAIALRYFERALSSQPESIAARYHLGVAAYAQLQEDRARQAFEWVRDRCQSLPSSYDDRQACQGAAGWLQRLSSSRP